MEDHSQVVHMPEYVSGQGIRHQFVPLRTLLCQSGGKPPRST